MMAMVKMMMIAAKYVLSTCYVPGTMLCLCALAHLLPTITLWGVTTIFIPYMSYYTHTDTQRKSFNLSITWWFHHFQLYLLLPQNCNHQFGLHSDFLLLVKEASSLRKLISPQIIRGHFSFLYHVVFFLL